VPHINPGAVEAYIADCEGFGWQVVAKFVDFHENLGPDTEYPCDATMTCVVTKDGGDCVWVDLAGGLTRNLFEVPRSALVEEPN
jgi:hypothetical protein